MKTTFFALTLLVHLTARAQTEAKPHMQDFFLSTKQISGYLIDKAEFLNEKNEKAISQTLMDFSQKTVNLKKEKMAKSDDMKFRVKLLSDGLYEAEQSFRQGSKDYSYWVLKSSLNNCFACHTQKGLGATEYKFDFDKEYDQYNQAEFYFLVRSYPAAIEKFEKLLLEYPQNKLSVENLENSINRILFYNVRVLKNDEKSLELFERLLKNEKLPSSFRVDILAWKKYLTVKKYRLVEDQEIKKPQDLEDFILDRNQIAGHYKLSNQRYIVDLETSSFLYQLLEKPEYKKLKPWTLYWLSVQEKDYRLSMFDLSVDNYLKECIERYTKHPAAAKCFELYKELTVDSFTGSRGTQLPPSVSEQLDNYEKLIKKK